MIEVEQQVPGHIQSILGKAEMTHERLKALLATERHQEDATCPFTVANQQASRIIEGRFGNRKHLQHLQWFFALLRRKRLLGRRRAIEAALELVNGLGELRGNPHPGIPLNSPGQTAITAFPQRTKSRHY